MKTPIYEAADKLVRMVNSCDSFGRYDKTEEQRIIERYAYFFYRSYHTSEIEYPVAIERIFKKVKTFTNLPPILYFGAKPS